jgi:hypothetical protein
LIDDDDAFDDDDAILFATGIDPDTVTTGAAADSADHGDDPLKHLPRLLRYAVLASDNDAFVKQRLLAEIAELCPDLPHAMAWAATPDAETGLALAAELDHLAVLRDLSQLRSLGDAVRLLSLSLPCDARRLDDFRRVTKAMILAFTESANGLDDQRRSDLERFIYGWAALPTAIGLSGRASQWPAIRSAIHLGDEMARYRVRTATLTTAHRVRQSMEWQRRAISEPAAATPPVQAAPVAAAAVPTEPASAGPLPPHHAVIGRMHEDEIDSPKLKGIIEPVRDVLNIPVPMVRTPALDRVRTILISEFPYATEVIDAALTDLIGRPTIRLRPLLLIGDPGGGKSRFARRLGELLGLSIWRVDASQSDGATLGGTDRRWHSAECCHPLLAIARGKTANPLILLDELEKAATQNDNGRLWDCLLGLLEFETSARYPDPALQIPLDLSHVSYIATANTCDPLPAPLKDRFRIIVFPKPVFGDLDALLPELIRGLAAERGIDSRWIAPLAPDERRAIANAWPGGSVRRLHHILEAILLARDHATPRH